MQITQSSGFLFDLLREVRSGTLLPAAFQRPYVWSKQDVEALCDSVLTGFPIGGFLVWEPGTLGDVSQLGRSRLGPVAAKIDQTCATGYCSMARTDWRRLPG